MAEGMKGWLRRHRVLTATVLTVAVLFAGLLVVVYFFEDPYKGERNVAEKLLRSVEESAGLQPSDRADDQASVRHFFDNPSRQQLEDAVRRGVQVEERVRTEDRVSYLVTDGPFRGCHISVRLIDEPFTYNQEQIPTWALSASCDR